MKINKFQQIAILQTLLLTIILNVTAQAAGVDPRVIQELTATGQVKTVIALNLPETTTSGRLRAASVAMRDPIGETQEEVLNSLPSGSYELTYQYSHVPGLAMTVTQESFAILKDHPQVKYIQYDELEHVALAEAIPWINADDVNSGTPPLATGAGVTVAVLDSGINTSHIDFSGKIVAQTCYLVNNPSTNRCPPSYTATTGTSAEDGLGHGTHVSGIIAANGTNVINTTPPKEYKGVAPSAKIAAVKVCNNNTTGGCQSSDSIAGLNWVLLNHTIYEIKIVNMSIASGTLYSDSCDTEDPTRKAAIDSLINAGITVFAAAGNVGNQPNGKSTLAAPACLSNTIAVGATHDTASSSSLCPSQNVTTPDTVACFSNSNKWLDILAPGSAITSSWLGSNTATQSEAGTSMATPMAAGVAALMLEKNPNLTPAQIKAKLRKTGVNVTDTNGIARPRIDAFAAVNNVDTPQAVLEIIENGSYLRDGAKLDFGWTTTNDPIIKTIKLKNAGTASLNLTLTNISSGFSLDASFPATLAAGAEYSLPVRFVTTTAGNYTGTLQFTTTDTLANSIQLNFSAKVCPMQTLPFLEGFESGSFPNCWRTIDNNYSIANWGVYPAGGILTAINDNYSAGIESKMSSPSPKNDDWLILPRIVLGNNTQFTFKASTESGSEDFKVHLSTTGNDPIDFNTTIATITTATISTNTPPLNSESYSYTLNTFASAGQKVYLAIQSVSPRENNSVLIIDNISITDSATPTYQNGTPDINNLTITTTGFDLTVQLDEMGKVYYAVFPSAASAPDVTQVKSGTGAIVSGSIDITAANSNFDKKISGLNSDTTYKVYVVSEDASANLQTTVTTLDVKTKPVDTPPPIPQTPITSTPSTPPSYTVIERKDGTGTGKITSVYVGQSGWTSLAALSATPDPDSVFVKWTGNTYSPDCYSDQPTIYVRLNAVKTCTATFDKITADNQSLIPIKLAAYYLPGVENSGQAFVRITNDNSIPATVKGTLYHATGQLLGIANCTLIQNLAPQATTELTTKDLAQLCSAPAWTGLAWLHITTPSGLKLLNLLENDNKMISNLTTVSTDNVLYNLPPSTHAEQASILLINTTDKIQPVTATLYGMSGQILGQANTTLAEVAARGIFSLSIKQLEVLVGTQPWTGQVAKLQIHAPEIKTMAILLSQNAAIMNLTPTHDNAAFNIPGATNLDQAFVYITNTTNTAISVTATLYHQDGYLLGTPNSLIINSLAPHATQIFSVADLEKLFKVATWQKRARLQINNPANGIKVMSLIHNDFGTSNLSSISNQAYCLPNSSFADKAYIRITNTTDLPVTVNGILYGENGQILGNSVLIPQLTAQTTNVISMPLLENILKTTSWMGKARLVLNPSSLQVMGTVRSNTGQLLDMSDISHE